MSRGRIPEEKLDDRTWQELVDQARSLIPHYTPEWTDRSPSDLGVTLIELFAWLVEGLTYRLNRVPERTYVAMLNLMGVTRDPPRPASIRLVLTPQPGVNPAPKVKKASRFGTLGSETAPAVVFETDHEVTVLPANLRVAFFLGPQGGPPREVTTDLVTEPLPGLMVSLANTGKAEFYLGLDAGLATEVPLHIGLAGLPVLSPPEANLTVGVKWEHSIAGGANWKAITTGISDGTTSMKRSGEVRLPLLTDWAARKGGDLLALPDKHRVKKEAYWWLRLTIEARKRDTTQPDPLVGDRITLTLEDILFNSVSATHVITVPESEGLDDKAASNGEPWQRLELKRWPIYRMPRTRLPYRHVVVTVHEVQPNGTIVPREWTMVDEFAAGPVRCYRLDPVTGTVMFGNHDGGEKSIGTGLIPPKNSRVTASYRAVAGGSVGNVAPGTVRLYAGIDGVMAVTNPGAGRDGIDEEPVAETKRRAPEMLRSRNRAVTAEDYEYLAREASTLVARVRALPTRLDWEKWEKPSGMLRHPGTVQVLIVPSLPGQQVPTPPEELIDEVASYLAARRSIGAAVYVRGPTFRPVQVSATVRLFRSKLDDPTFFTQLDDALTQAATRYLHPLLGGPEGQGWDIGQDVLVSGLFARLQPLVGVEGLIEKIQVKLEPARLAGEQGLVRGNLADTVGVRLLEYEMVCSAGTHLIDVTEL